MRARDFFILDEDSTIEVNGGHPPLYVLNEDLLDDLITESLPLASDASVAEGLLELVHDELVGYGTDGSQQLYDKQIARAIRALEAVTWRLGMPLKLPFRTSSRSVPTGYATEPRATAAGKPAGDIVAELLDLAREELDQLRRDGKPQIHEDLIANLRIEWPSGNIWPGSSA